MKNIKQMTGEDMVVENLKCRKSFFYFLYNYVYIEISGDKLKMTPETTSYPVKRMIKNLFKFENVVFQASRQLGKTTIASSLLLWTMIFFPRIKTVAISYTKGATADILDRMKFTHMNLPDWLINVNNASIAPGGDLVFGMKLKNGSVINCKYPSTTAKPIVLARGLSTPIVYIDEVGFIKGIDDIYTSAIPAMTEARLQAHKTGYPSFTLLSSTPNGKKGDGEFWFNLFQNSLDGDLLFEEYPNDNIIDKNIDFRQDAMDMFKNHETSFVKTEYHWSMDKRKNPDAIDDPEEIKKIPWYIEQCKTVQNDRKVAQEYDLMFLAGSSSVFTAEFLKTIKQSPPYKIIKTPHDSKFTLYKPILPNDYYLIGVDTAGGGGTLMGDKSCIEVFKYSTFEQVGEYFGREGMLYKVSDILKEVMKYVLKMSGNKVIVCIETNGGFGRAIIENLMVDTTFDYMKYVYSDKPNVPGITTTVANRGSMISHLYENFTSDPSVINSANLISEVSTLDRKSNGKIEASSGYHDDGVMASAFCALVRAKTILKYMPLITNEENTFIKNETTVNNMFKLNFNISGTKEPSNKDVVFNDEEDLFEYENDFDYGNLII